MKKRQKKKRRKEQTLKRTKRALKKKKKNKERTKEHESLRGMTRNENICWQFYLAGVDLQLSAFEQYFVAAVATAALNASSKGWFH